MSFDKCINFILSEEKGYVNDPDDSGGATNFGITKAVLAAYRQAPVTDDDMKNLEVDEAKAIYEKNYYDPIQGDMFHDGYDLVLFDAAVQHGVVTAIKMAQRAVGVAPDGVIGAVTIRAITNDKDFIANFQAERLLYYMSLMNWGRFGKGWTRRLIRIAVAAST